MNYRYKLDKLPILLDRVNSLNTTWDSDNSELVKYKFNDYGYRSSYDYKSLMDSNKIICIGCSFTEGIGLDIEETWPYLLSQKIGLPYLNLGIAGGSDGYVMWQIMNVIKYIQTEHIFVLSPPSGRFFELSDTNFESRQSWDAETINSFTLSALCDRYNISHINTYQYGEEQLWSRAKDNQHFGLDYQTKITEEFYKLLQNKLI
jgi:hypothetical protein